MDIYRNWISFNMIFIILGGEGSSGIWQKIKMNLLFHYLPVFWRAHTILTVSENPVWVTIIHLTHIQCAHCRPGSGGHRHGLPQSQVPDGPLEGGDGPLRGLPHPAHPRLFLQVGAPSMVIGKSWPIWGNVRIFGIIVKIRLRVSKGKGWSNVVLFATTCPVYWCCVCAVLATWWRTWPPTCGSTAPPPSPTGTSSWCSQCGASPRASSCPCPGTSAGITPKH